MARMAQAAGARFHCDAAQGFGKIPARIGEELGDAAFVSISAHKIHGPKGIGALVAAPGVPLAPLFDGGLQERARSGTQSPGLAAGFGAAVALAGERMAADAAHARLLGERALAILGTAGIAFEVNGPAPGGPDRIPTNLNLRFAGVAATRLIAALPDLLLTSGSACASASGKPSHVLAALGLSADARAQSLRIGWGRTTTLDELERGITSLAAEVSRRQRAAA
jgi:cysteine desulfurase